LNLSVVRRLLAGRAFDAGLLPRLKVFHNLLRKPVLKFFVGEEHAFDEAFGGLDFTNGVARGLL